MTELVARICHRYLDANREREAAYRHDLDYHHAFDQLHHALALADTGMAANQVPEPDRAAALTLLLAGPPDAAAAALRVLDRRERERQLRMQPPLPIVLPTDLPTHVAADLSDNAVTTTGYAGEVS